MFSTVTICTSLMTPTDHERTEWARMSRAMPLGNARNTYAGLAASRDQIRLDCYDYFMHAYREWLVFNIIPEFSI